MGFLENRRLAKLAKEAEKDFTGLRADEVPDGARELQARIQHLGTDMYRLKESQVLAMNGDLNVKVFPDTVMWEDDDGCSYVVGAQRKSNTTDRLYRYYKDPEVMVEPQVYAHLHVAPGDGPRVTDGPLGMDGTYHGQPPLTPKQSAEVSAMIGRIEQEIARMEAQVDIPGSYEHTKVLQEMRRTQEEAEQVIIQASYDEEIAAQEQWELENAKPQLDAGTGETEVVHDIETSDQSIDR